MRREGRIVALAAGDLPPGECPPPGRPAAGPPREGRARVELSAGACARCARGRGCGAALFSPAAGGAPMLDCELPAALGVMAIGDRVGVELDGRDGRWLGAVLLVYALPTAGLLGGALLPEPWAPLGAIGGLLGGILAWRLPGAARLLDTLAGPCPVSARIVSIDSQESR